MGTIDIYSKGEYPADVLSNFSPNSFVFDGVHCSSMEGFLQSLKYRNAKKQLKICALTGITAKNAGTRKFWWKLTGNLYWKGKRYKRESKQFDDLRLQAYRALGENAHFRKALSDSENAILKHSIGAHDKRKTILTEEEFIGYLEYLRSTITEKSE